MKKANDGSTLPQLIDCKYQYISIIETLRALIFKNQRFREIYEEYNKEGSITNALPECIQISAVDRRSKIMSSIKSIQIAYN